MRHIVPGLRKLEALKDVLLPLAGVICIIFPEHLTRSLPEGLGCVMLLTGILRLPSALREQEHKKLETMETAIAMVLIVLGVATLLMRHHALTMIGCTWGLFGVFKGTRILNHAIYNFTRRTNGPFCWQRPRFKSLWACCFSFTMRRRSRCTLSFWESSCSSARSSRAGKSRRRMRIPSRPRKNSLSPRRALWRRNI